MDKIDIQVERVSMRYRLSNQKVYSLKELFIRKIRKELHYDEFYALNSVDITIYQGERVGIIGHNGAGKSTLLKIISGVMKPTEGKVLVKGNVAPLLALGAGFDLELTGYENIFLNGAILGKSKKYLESKLNDIIEFSELGKFIHIPVKNYSSGMRARLGFSIATHIDPDILVIDEVLGVGDEKFRKKSSKRMIEIMDSGKTTLLVSHSLNQIKNLTNRVIWLNKGQVVANGETMDICREYEKFIKK